MLRKHGPVLSTLNNTDPNVSIIRVQNVGPVTCGVHQSSMSLFDGLVPGGVFPCIKEGSR
ncbi:hypothetical protein DCCM_2885 [Desulfocucumis palustris]|uniref:Uncharacterized protein n=1 Tax=Desulfocucumis palustris TaxID=1898651 RepID=A0A2L2XCP6_9FIRM|nr:hypothetical protein DCCM_2885 [Desulfocucumis palustris]